MNTTMMIAIRTLFAAAIVPAQLVAQGANVDVTVFPQAVVGQPPPSRAGFLVCVGTATDLDQYGTEITPTGGVANQNFRNLPVGATVRVTVTKAGYVGIQLNTTLRTGWDNHLQASMRPGTGGATCAPATAIAPPPSAPVRLDGTPIYPVSPTPPPAPAPAPAPLPRLGEQTLTHWGRAVHSSEYRTLDCKAFGTNWVAAGIFGKSGEGIDLLGVKCRKMTTTGIAGAETRNTGTHGGTAGTTFERNCPSNSVMIGVSGKIEREQVRSVVIYCKTLDLGRATSGTALTVSSAGGTAGTQWGPDVCAGGRSVRAIKVGRDIFLSGIPLGNLFAPDVIAAVQLICEQPTY